LAILELWPCLVLSPGRPQTHGVTAIVPASRNKARSAWSLQGPQGEDRTSTQARTREGAGPPRFKTPSDPQSCNNHHALDSLPCSRPSEDLHGCDSSEYQRPHGARASMTLMVARGMYKNVTCILTSCCYPSNTHFFHLHISSVASAGSGILFTSSILPSTLQISLNTKTTPSFNLQQT
jgi:hypothetical protein